LKALPVLFLRGTPRERGIAYGVMARERIDDSLAFYADVALHAFGVTFGSLCDRMRENLPNWRSQAREYLDEIEGIAMGSGRLIEEILALNARPSLVSRPVPTASGECTSWAVLASATADRHVYTGQNWDFLRGAADSLVILHIGGSDQPHQVVLAEAGQLGRQGANAKGLALQANGLGVGAASSAIPGPILRRQILAQATLTDAWSAASKAVGVVGNLLLADRNGEVVDLEMSESEIATLIPDEAWYAHSNHFLAPVDHSAAPRPAASVDSIARERWTRKRLATDAANGGISLTTLMTMARVESDGEVGICCHAADQRDPLGWQTVASAITDLTDGVMWVAAGPPCSNAFFAIDIETGDRVGVDSTASVTGVGSHLDGKE
jgi:isopenicillin-N N-acyltransferase-like protein